MQYKTIVLHLLEQRPEMYDRLHRERQLLPALERFSQELKSGHEAWTDRLLQAKPDSDTKQIASEAMELALQDLQARMPSESMPSEDEPLSLDEAMAFLRDPMPPA